MLQENDTLEKETEDEMGKKGQRIILLFKQSVFRTKENIELLVSV